MPNSPSTTAAIHKRQELAKTLRELASGLAAGDRLPSISDLERQYGVSTTTVEAALKTLTRDGVIVRRRGSGTFVAEQLGAPRVFTPSGRQRHEALRTRKETLAVLALYANNFFEHVVRLISVSASARGMAVMSRYDNHEMTLEDALSLERMEPVGVLVVGTELEWAAREFVTRGHRTVLVGEPLVGQPITVPNVCSDSEYGGYLATKHLLDLGHRRLLMAHPFITEEELFQRSRWQGHLRALKEVGLENAPFYLHIHEVIEKGSALFQTADAPTAVVCWGDGYAAHLITHLQQQGMRVPEDISVMGYDNLPEGMRSKPAVDTVDQHLDAQVRHALFLLSAPTSSAVGEGRALVSPTLIVRGSCAVPLV